MPVALVIARYALAGGSSVQMVMRNGGPFEAATPCELSGRKRWEVGVDLYCQMNGGEP